jgi:murein DD-endopeptidase MepM/ murein hydrolase activator NlpD
MIDRINFVGWMWPVFSSHGRFPVVSHEFEAGERYKPDGSLNYAVHLGLDIMFQRWASDPTGPATDVAIPKHGTNQGFITWPGTKVVCVGPGKVWEAGETKLGHHVLVDHGKVGGVGLLTYYQHLESFARPWQRGDAVFPGLALGVMGGDPSNEPHLRHLHFEVWLPDGKPDQGDWPVDPQPYLDAWAKL